MIEKCCLGAQEEKARGLCHHKSHTAHVNKVPALCLVLGWVPAHWRASDTIPHVNKQLLDRVICTRIEICTVSSGGRGPMESSTQRGTERVSQSRHAACLNTFEKGIERKVGVQPVEEREGWVWGSIPNRKDSMS